MSLSSIHAGEVESLMSENEKVSTEDQDVVYSDAVKQLLIEKPPLVLNLHLKRFVQVGRHVRKNSRHVSFPATLDMALFCKIKSQVFYTIKRYL